ncbi:MAG: GspE/PulE family protein [Gammaproteobacteria bacterium]|nr:GspE/PulE family protein [Gammaproteobacteria bacterium]
MATVKTPTDKKTGTSQVNWSGFRIGTEQKKLDFRTVVEGLLEDGLIDDKQREQLYRATPTLDGETHPLTQVINEKPVNAKPPHKLLDAETLTEWLASKIGLPYYHIDPLKTDVGPITTVMKYSYAQRNRILPVAINDQEVVIAVTQPAFRDWEQEISRAVRKPIKRVFANPADVSRYTVEFYSLAKSVSQASRDHGASDSGLNNLEQLVELGRTGKLDADDQHVVTIVDWLLQYAFDQRASDIHVEPRRDQGNIRFRIDGVLHLVYQLPPPVTAAVTSRLKILGRMDVAEKRRPQDGRIKTRTPDDKEIELRLSTMPTAFGEKLVMRIFDPEVLVRSFKELGLNDDDLSKWNDMVSRPHGIILVTGPTGSGKTTTLYSTLKHLARPEVNVCTIEDPIEMIDDSLNQMQVQSNIDLDFAAGVRNLLRQDPDIIMVGEIRDRETADMAVQAALTGHLVLSTLHTNDAPTAITRLMEIGVPAYLLNATLVGIVAQRLVRTLCPHCKEKTTVDESQWQALIAPWTVHAPKQVCKPAGCLECRNTGYQGRIGIYEVMSLSAPLHRLIDEEGDIASLRRQAYKEGMHSLRLSGAEKVARGLTTIEEVMKVAPPHIEK